MEQVYKAIKNCCGCAKCEAVCPTNAITMQFKGGHYYPVINKDLCIDCKKCAKECNFTLNNNGMPLFAYAVKHNEKIRMQSSSGGAFTALSDYILKNGGRVYGADFDNNMHLCHTLADTPQKRDRMRGTKYIQSDMTGVYKQIRADLKANLPVLFVGTPCQVNAVKSYVGENEGLYTADLICHGVPSPEVWKKYIEYIEKKFGKKIKFFSFRNKDIAWRSYSGRITFSDDSVLSNTDLSNAYIELFRYDLTLRECCTSCPFTSLSRVGDITLGDFWGIENVLPEIDDNKGISAVFVNTEKGAKLFEAVKGNLECFKVSSEQIAKRQPNLSRPSVPSIKAEAFKSDITTLSFERVLKKYTRVGFKRRIIDFIKRILHK